MSELHWFSATDSPDCLPDPTEALSEPNGLLAAGGSLSSDWLLTSYRRGIFPWFEPGQPILWWSPDPRTVLVPGALKVSRSLKKRISRNEFSISADRNFADVIGGCAEPRSYTNGTWITPLMQSAYCRLHAEGWAHSFEAWRNDELVGGLYGIAIGKVFFGESMFTRETDASKVAFHQAVQFLIANDFELIDCQLPSQHLASLGATSLPREEFLESLQRLTAGPGLQGPWTGRFLAWRQNCGL